MDYLENSYEEKKPLLKRIFSLRLLLFVAAYILYMLVSRIQMYAGEFILQGSGDFDSVTAYDYILPAINSFVCVVTTVLFIVAGYIAYGKDKVKMLRFPMAFCIASTVGDFLSSLLTAVFTSPFLESNGFSYTKIQEYAVILIAFVSAFILYLYFDGESEDNVYYDDEYYNENPLARRSLRERILRSRFSVTLTVFVICGVSSLIGKAVFSILATVMAFVPDDFIWLGNYIDIVSDVFIYSAYIILTYHFAKNKRMTVKFIGLVLVVKEVMQGFSFIANSVSNVFASAGDNLINSVFSSIFVSMTLFLIGFAELAVLIFVCYKLKKIKNDTE